MAGLKLNFPNSTYVNANNYTYLHNTHVLPLHVIAVLTQCKALEQLAIPDINLPF